MTQQQLEPALFHWADQDNKYLTEGDLRGAVREGSLLRVKHGIYGDAAAWDDLALNEQYRELVLRYAERARHDSAVISHTSAAALWRLPLPGYWPQPVHFSGFKRHRGTTDEHVIRHSISVPASDVVTIDGTRCTSLARTVIDIALAGPLEHAVMCADAAAQQYILQECGENPPADRVVVAGMHFKQLLRDEAAKRPGRKGVRNARFIADFANWLAESPAESVTRLRMHQIELEPPELQVAVPAPNGGSFRLDFLLRNEGVFAEFDGLSKYADDPAVGHQQWLVEKERQDWIQSTTGWRCVRLMWKDIKTLPRFETFARKTGLIL